MSFYLEPGRLMARYYIAYDSMKQFLNIKGTESLSDIVDLVSKCREFSDVKLRMNEKRVLNTLNKDKNSETIRFPIKGRIKTTEQKVNCLIQATLGSLPIAEFSLSQDVTKIFRAGQRITRCLTELQMLKSSFMSLQNSVIFAKCMRARLWENSKFVSRQLEKVGPSLSTMMVNAGLTSLKKIEETNPREIELIVNRHPPFGSQIREAASNLPKYDVSVQQTGKHQPNRSEIVISVTMMNYIKRKDAIGSGRNSHFCILMIADTENNVVFKQRLGDFVFLKEGYWSKRVDIQRTAAQSPDLNLHLISQEYVGLDVSKRFSPQYSVGRPYIIMKNELQAYAPKLVKNNVSNLESHSSTSTSEAGTPRVPCSHRCLNKEVCGHECCKQGGNSKKRKKKSEVEQKKGPHRLPLMSTPSIDDQKETTVMDEQGNLNSFLKNLHMRTQAIPGTPAKRLKSSASETVGANFVDLTLDKRFGYTRRIPFHHHMDSGEGRNEETAVTEKECLGSHCWEEVDWHLRKGEEQKDASKDDDQVDDELPCFSLDELWNENELALTLNDESDAYACPQELNSWQKRNKSLHSHYFNVAAPENCQKISVVQRPMPRSSRIIAESNAKVNSGAPLFLGNSQSNRQLGKYSQHAPPPPPIPGAEDFDLTVYSGSAKNTSSSYWNEGQLTPTSSGKMKQSPRPRSPSEDPYNALEVEDWNILPVFAKSGGQINVLRSKKKTQNETNLSSSLSSTRFDTPFLLGRSCLHKGKVVATEDGCTQRCQQSPCSASFFCSKSSESCEQDFEEKDAFEGIFNGLL